jgi:UV DNA damage repair endonuclease
MYTPSAERIFVRSNSDKYNAGSNKFDIVSINLNFPVQNLMVLSNDDVAYAIDFVFASKAHIEVISSL